MNSKLLAAPLLLGAGLSLSGCGGAGTALSYSQRLSDANAIINTADGVVSDPITSLPASATYVGAATFDHTPTGGPGFTEFVGRVDLNVDFAGETANGSISNVVDDTSASYSGQLTIFVNESVDPSTGFSGTGDDRTFDGALDGVLNGPSQLIVTNGSIDADFGGSTATHVSGFIDASSSLGGVSGDLQGDWGASQTSSSP